MLRTILNSSADFSTTVRASTFGRVARFGVALLRRTLSWRGNTVFTHKSCIQFRRYGTADMMIRQQQFALKNLRVVSPRPGSPCVPA